VVNTNPAPVPGEWPGILYTGGRVGPSADLDEWGELHCHWDSIAGPSNQ